MVTYCGRRPAAMALVCALIAAATGMGARRAEAYELKLSPNGQELRWARSHVSYVVDPSLEAATPGGGQAVTTAIGGWDVGAGLPAMSVAPGKGGAKVGADGQNQVLFAREGFAPAGNALAVTVTTYDQVTGEIVDTDIVVNGIHTFAVLDAERADQESPVPTDGAPSMDGSQSTDGPYDLVHVLSHELGHSLGLADVQGDHSVLMYAYTSQGDASIRRPTADDINGVDALYKDSPPLDAAWSVRGGCSQASVVATRPRFADAYAVLAIMAGAGIWLGARRRRPEAAQNGGRATRSSRPELRLAATLAALVLAPAPSASTIHDAVPELQTDATARVVGVSTSNANGLFETTVELEPTACRRAPCPTRASVHAWGGTLGGLTQEVGNNPVPTVGDMVDVVFVPSRFRNVDMVAKLITVRH